MIIYLYRYYGIWTYYHCRTMLCCLILIVVFSNLIICLYRLILWLILEYGNCANRCKKVQQQLSVEAYGKNGHIIYDVDLIVLDILKVAEYLGRVCYEKKIVTYDAKLGIIWKNFVAFIAIHNLLQLGTTLFWHCTTEGNEHNNIHWRMHTETLQDNRSKVYWTRMGYCNDAQDTPRSSPFYCDIKIVFKIRMCIDSPFEQL